MDRSKSKLINRFQSLTTVEEEEDWTTVKKNRAPASPKSQHTKCNRDPSTRINQADAGGKRLDLDWRTPQKPTQPSGHFTVPRQARNSTSGYSRASHYRENGVKDSPRSSYRNSQNPNTRKLYGKDFFQPGMIIRADLHEEDFKASRPSMASAKTITAPNGAVEVSKGYNQPPNIHTKERKMIIVACYERHYICIPLYSHEGYGLKNKNESEYISVSDHRSTLKDFKPLSKHGALATEYLHEGIEPYLPMTAAHITYPVSRNYELAVVHEGNLKKEDLRHLVKLFNKYCA
ncbi:MAG: hypothetical protein HETSPECPRED_007862 [Heterodermia speciosa]|uniref:DUF6590 domain-containing protein n=1 Tax=Heterodermia speciosa TaxID=116794 RepID=A0A8H3FYN2_9LECA|nr:MAG: hypothetical protein HETSPECPRED_007862 [Heterodermia speciosa]